MNIPHQCACGCSAPINDKSTYKRGHNRRGKGRGWIGSGYRFISVNGRAIAEHRHVVQMREGRGLARHEVVHHVDGDPLNNDPANLVVLTRSEHNRLHGYERRTRWSSDETQRARQLRVAGLTIHEVATALGRPFSSTARVLATLRSTYIHIDLSDDDWTHLATFGGQTSPHCQ
jgi:hypothetical protein